MHIINVCICVFLQVYTYKQNALSRQRVYEMHSSSVCGVEDMAALQDLHEGAILHNLHLRYTQRCIYVSVHTHTHTHTEESCRELLLLHQLCVGVCSCFVTDLSLDILLLQ